MVILVHTGSSSQTDLAKTIMAKNNIFKLNVIVSPTLPCLGLPWLTGA